MMTVWPNQVQHASVCNRPSLGGTPEPRDVCQTGLSTLESL